MQWLGGIGIIVMAITILPLLKVGGMQLFKMEGPDSTEKFTQNYRSSSNNNIHLFNTNISMWFFLLGVWYDNI